MLESSVGLRRARRRQDRVSALPSRPMLHDIYVFVVVPLALLLGAVALFLVLFEPSVAYRVVCPTTAPRDEAFAEQLATLCGAVRRRVDSIEVFSRGEAFYEAELVGIRAATRSIHLEAYIFHTGRAADRFVNALTERARAGVKVRLTLDAFGNLFVPIDYFRELLAAGGQVQWYQPLRWYTLKRYNNRTHRELLVIDGSVAFIGGAGVADWWIGDGGKPPWRDTVLRFEGALVPPLLAVFAENWLAAAGEILFGDDDGPRVGSSKNTSEGALDAPLGFLVQSTPSEARATRARLLLQTLIAGARNTIRIQTPYFVPDRSARRELVRAVERGVSVEIIVPGSWNNHQATRLASRARYGDLLKAGIVIREYAASMIHTKTLIVDGHVSVVGSSNWDNRSTSLNDEINLVVSSDELAARLGEDFAKDASQSRAITYEDWRRRNPLEKIAGVLASTLARQA
jgi:cardiolipin synthase